MALLRLFINLTPQRVFDLYPPLLLKERGKRRKRGVSSS
jgi:hypothetical protein